MRSAYCVLHRLLHYWTVSTSNRHMAAPSSPAATALASNCTPAAAVNVNSNNEVTRRPRKRLKPQEENDEQNNDVISSSSDASSHCSIDNSSSSLLDNSSSTTVWGFSFRLFLCYGKLRRLLVFWTRKASVNGWEDSWVDWMRATFCEVDRNTQYSRAGWVRVL